MVTLEDIKAFWIDESIQGAELITKTFIERINSERFATDVPVTVVSNMMGWMISEPGEECALFAELVKQEIGIKTHNFN